MGVTYTYFTATTATGGTPVVNQNLSRRRLEIWSFGAPEEADTNGVWVNDVGAPAVPFQCKQMIPGAVWQYGGNSDLNEPLRLYFTSCPTGAISVRTTAGTHRGLIVEYLNT